MNKQLSDILNSSFQAYMSNVHTALPGKIESFDPTTNKASVLPLIKKKFENGEVLNMPIISNVPVVFPSTQKGGIVFPISKGDGCLILFSERSLEQFLSGGVSEVEPGDPRKFSMTDGICLPGLYPFGSPGTTGNGVDLEIKYNGNVVINQGINGAARQTDATLSTPADDAIFWTWIAGAATILAGLGLAALPPVSLTGKITGGSTSVKIGG